MRLIYIYGLYSYIFDDYLEGRIFSKKELSNEELGELIGKAIKVLGEDKSEDPRTICKYINEKILKTNPEYTDIKRFREAQYIFANSYNCGGYHGQKKINDWLKTYETKKDDSYKSKRVFTWWESWPDRIRYYVPTKFLLRFII